MGFVLSYLSFYFTVLCSLSSVIFSLYAFPFCSSFAVPCSCVLSLFIFLSSLYLLAAMSGISWSRFDACNRHRMAAGRRQMATKTNPKPIQYDTSTPRSGSQCKGIILGWFSARFWQPFWMHLAIFLMPTWQHFCSTWQIIWQFLTHLAIF